MNVNNEPCIVVENLRKNYGAVEAVRGISFEVKPGEVFGLLGPNGAGKTTTLEILEGLRQRDGGAARVLGLDPGTDSKILRDRIGVALQSTALPPKLKVREALALFSRLYSRKSDAAPLLKRLQLEEKADAFFSQLSGGQKQRLALALALINDPQVIFLDEPSTGLDPQARREIHSLIESLRAEGRTVVLTTHYIEEAERLCDRVGIVDHGQLIALGPPAQLQREHLAGGLIEIRLAAPLPGGALPALNGAKIELNEDRRHLLITSEQPAKTLVEAVKWLDGAHLAIEDLSLKRPSLEDVFIALTGRRLRE
jgi:ABC-2 type transport system ATP-binding protein